VYAALRAGDLDCERWPWSASLAVLELTDEIRRQTGIVYPGE
jgi:hypothetical protein